jgi:hypothetical protein
MPQACPPAASGDSTHPFLWILPVSLCQCIMSSQGPPPRLLLLAARHSWWLQLISESGNIVHGVISETWEALSCRAICGVSVWVGASAATLPLAATLTAPLSSTTANCSTLTRRLSPFRDTGKWNFLADVSKSSVPLGMTIGSFCRGLGVVGAWFQHWTRDSSWEKNQSLWGLGWRILLWFWVNREHGIQWNDGGFTASKVLN